MVRKAIRSASRRLPTDLLLFATSSCISLRSAPVGRACCRSRHADCRSHQEWQSRSVHASSKRHLVRADTAASGHRPCSVRQRRGGQPSCLTTSYSPCSLARRAASDALWGVPVPRPESSVTVLTMFVTNRNRIWLQLFQKKCKNLWFPLQSRATPQR